VPGCGNSCSDIGCIQNLTITPDGTVDDSGKYEARFDADGEAITCTLTVPSTTPPKCTDSHAYVYQNDGRVRFLSLDGDYKTVSVTLLHEGTVIADESFAPEYTDDELNGSGCGTCLAASATLRIGAPTISDAGAPPPGDGGDTD
jgi:hypothetical protein